MIVDFENNRKARDNPHYSAHIGKKIIELIEGAIKSNGSAGFIEKKASEDAIGDLEISVLEGLSDDNAFLLFWLGKRKDTFVSYYGVFLHIRVAVCS